MDKHIQNQNLLKQFTAEYSMRRRRESGRRKMAGDGQEEISGRGWRGDEKE
jgi:hypothetical protein